MNNTIDAPIPKSSEGNSLLGDSTKLAEETIISPNPPESAPEENVSLMSENSQLTNKVQPILVELLDPKDGTNYYGTAKFDLYTISTRDNVTNGFQKFFVIAFCSEPNGNSAILYNYNSLAIETLPLEAITKEEGKSNYADFVRAREKFWVMISPDANTEQKTIVPEEKSSNKSASTVEKTAKRGRKPKVIPKKTETPERRSPRIARQSKTPIPEKTVGLNKSNQSTKKLAIKPRPVQPKKSSVMKLEESCSSVDESDSERSIPFQASKVSPPKVTKTHETRETKLNDTPAKQAINTEPKTVLSATTSSSELLPMSNPNFKIWSPTDAIAEATSKPLLIPLAWHEEKMGKIREAYLRQTIMNLQMNEMLQLTAPNSINKL